MPTNLQNQKHTYITEKNPLQSESVYLRDKEGTRQLMQVFFHRSIRLHSLLGYYRLDLYELGTLPCHSGYSRP